MEGLSNDDRSNSPLIDKFLKTFNVEDSDEENNSESNDKSAAKTIMNGEGKANESKDDKSINSETLLSNSKAGSAENSDCELLNDSLLHRKRTRPKSLEKMLSEVDKRRKTMKLDENCISLSSDSSDSDIEAVDVEPSEAKQRLIKPMLRQDQLAGETRKAQKQENDRQRRLEKKISVLNKALKEHADKVDKDDLILDYIEPTKTFIKVHPGIVKLLKKHQIDGVKFMYDSCYGSVEHIKKPSSGSGCILAHCMGLGKTLQVCYVAANLVFFLFKLLLAAYCFAAHRHKL